MPFYRLYILIEFVFVSLIFFQLIRGFPGKLLIKVFLAGFATYWIISVLIPGEIQSYPSILRLSESAFIVSYSGIYFVQIFRDGLVQNLFTEFGFWFSVGLTIYFASNSLLFIFSEFVVTLSDPSYYLIWTVHAFLTILLYIAYTIAIQCKTNHNLS